MNNLTISASPHITKSNHTTAIIMRDVLIALAPMVIVSCILYNAMVLFNVIICSLAAFGAEVLWDMIVSKSFNKEGFKNSSAHDLSCIVTGVILALNLPVFIDVWGLNFYTASKNVVFSFDTLIIMIVCSAFAILLVKKLFGGIGRNFANPALTARIFAVLCFGSSFVLAESIFDSGIVASSGATWLGEKGAMSGSVLLNMLVGNHATLAVGETCAIAILLGGAYLCIRQVIDYKLPLMIIAFSAVFALIFEAISGDPNGGNLILRTFAHVLSGGLLFGAIFMATDYATSPNTFVGNVIYAFGISLLVMLIRMYGGYPEGVSFAILIMNFIVPLLDRFIVPKPFGYVKKPREKVNNSKNESKKEAV